jgi:hypothetical protein
MVLISISHNIAISQNVVVSNGGINQIKSVVDRKLYGFLGSGFRIKKFKKLNGSCVVSYPGLERETNGQKQKEERRRKRKKEAEAVRVEKVRRGVWSFKCPTTRL